MPPVVVRRNRTLVLKCLCPILSHASNVNTGLRTLRLEGFQIIERRLAGHHCYVFHGEVPSQVLEAVDMGSLVCLGLELEFYNQGSKQSERMVFEWIRVAELLSPLTFPNLTSVISDVRYYPSNTGDPLELARKIQEGLSSLRAGVKLGVVVTRIWPISLLDV